MFIVESAKSINYSDVNMPEITDFSDDAYNIMEGSMFFEEGVSKIIRASALAEVCAFKEGTIDAFSEGVGEKIKEKLYQLWEKFKAFIIKVKDRFVAWVRKTFTSNTSFLKKYKKVISDNIYKLSIKNPSFNAPDFDKVVAAYSVFAKNSGVAVEAGANLHMATAAGMSDDELKSKYDKFIEDISDAYTKVKNELDSESEIKFKDLKVIKFVNSEKLETEKAENVIGEDYPEKIAKAFTKVIEDSVKTINDHINQLRGQKIQDKVAIKTDTIQKQKLEKSVQLITAISKKNLSVITKVAYAAVKLQHTKADSIKAESSLDILDKYLQRI